MKSKTPKTKTPKLRSIEAERAACTTAFERYPHSTHAWCCHHTRLFECDGGYQQRIEFIEDIKPMWERASRFRSYRPIKALAVLNARMDKCKYGSRAYWKSSDKYEKILTQLLSNQKTARAMYNREWPNNTWTGKRVKGT